MWLLLENVTTKCVFIRVKSNQVFMLKCSKDLCKSASDYSRKLWRLYRVERKLTHDKEVEAHGICLLSYSFDDVPHKFAIKPRANSKLTKSSYFYKPASARKAFKNGEE